MEEPGSPAMGSRSGVFVPLTQGLCRTSGTKVAPPDSTGPAGHWGADSGGVLEKKHCEKTAGDFISRIRCEMLSGRVNNYGHN